MRVKGHGEFMALALEQSTQGLPSCLPNPPVGCVLVRSSVVVATGFTQAPGRHHAEAMALQSTPGSLHDVIAYVTLEPCSFYGRTPSCAVSLISRSIGHVVVAMHDPDSRNNGRGIALLKAAGVTVTEGVLGKEVSAFLTPYLNLGLK